MRSPDKQVSMTISVHMDKTPKGDWIGHLSLLAPGAPTEVPLQGITVHASSVLWSAVVGPKVAFEAKWDNANNTLIGTATPDKGGPQEFSLKRMGEAKVVLPPANSAITSALVGRWSGTLQIKTAQELVLEFTQAPGGTGAGKFVSVNGQAAEVPVIGLTQNGSAVKFDVKAVGGAFAGTLDGAAGVLKGEWTDGTGKHPLVFKRTPVKDESKAK